jgi:hypothetical protein
MFWHAELRHIFWSDKLGRATVGLYVLGTLEWLAFGILDIWIWKHGGGLHLHPHPRLRLPIPGVA